MLGAAVGGPKKQGGGGGIDAIGERAAAVDVGVATGPGVDASGWLQVGGALGGEGLDARAIPRRLCSFHAAKTLYHCNRWIVANLPYTKSCSILWNAKVKEELL
jgi:hypothetical protein